MKYTHQAELLQID